MYLWKFQNTWKEDSWSEWKSRTTAKQFIYSTLTLFMIFMTSTKLGWMRKIIKRIKRRCRVSLVCRFMSILSSHPSATRKEPKAFLKSFHKIRKKTQPKTPHTLKALWLKSTGKLVYLDAYNVLSMYTFCSLKQSLQDCKALLTDLQEAVTIPFRTKQTV